MNIVFIVSLIIVFSFIWICRRALYQKRRGNIRLPRYSRIEGEDPDQLIRCLQGMVSSYSSEVRLDVGKVQEFQYETFLVLCAQAEKAHDSGKITLLYTSSIVHPSVRHILNLSRSNTATHHIHLVGVATQFVQQSKITPQVEEIVSKELRRIGIRDYYDLNTLVTEILGNALEHGIKDQKINWWMHHTVEKGVLKLIFVDMGTGIASSYRKAGIGLLKTDKQLIKKAMNGKVGSSTKQPNRGKGLRQINEMVKNNFISDFILITNSVTLRYNSNRYIIKTHPNFVGTYYSWTVNKDNFLKWQTWLTSQQNIAKH
ncbi:MAG: hypothetical protein K2K25_02950 [Muribaculaceae bacterium]|nr:hypothetical protein [Muribaculaceae bacterium]